ncbi:MAG: hypothetical protein IJD33_02415 [Clostridia bacterium]|nr:hypothetical protein [Clostridia bacterium]
MVKKAYELLSFRVIQRSEEDVLTTSVDQQDAFFIQDTTNWINEGNP